MREVQRVAGLPQHSKSFISPTMPTPETEARVEIDSKLVAAGWIVQDRGHVNLGAGAGIAVREFSLKPGHGTTDYLQYVDAE